LGKAAELKGIAMKITLDGGGTLVEGVSRLDILEVSGPGTIKFLDLVEVGELVACEKSLVRVPALGTARGIQVVTKATVEAPALRKVGELYVAPVSTFAAGASFMAGAMPGE
jgi:hypothetical protein